MPLRAAAYGKISPSRAADISVDVTEAVAVKMNYDFPPGAFCIEFRKQLTLAFPVRYPNLGASVTL